MSLETINNPLLRPHLMAILREMHRRVGADIKNTNFKKEGWYIKHSWTKTKEKDFEKWLINYMKNNREARFVLMPIPSRDDKFLRRWASDFIFNLGWAHKKMMVVK